MKRKSRNKGITLVALVITIILLLIIAGISVAKLTEEQGLFTRAEAIAETNEKAKAKDEVSLAIASVLTEYLFDKSKVTPKMIADQVNVEFDRDAYAENETTFPTYITYPANKSNIGKLIKVAINKDIEITGVETVVEQVQTPEEDATGTQTPVSDFDITANQVQSTSISISYQTTSTAGNILRYVIIANGEYVDTTNQTTYTISGLSSGTTYVIKVVAIDSEGNTRTSTTTQITK